MALFLSNIRLRVLLVLSLVLLKIFFGVNYNHDVNKNKLLSKNSAMNYKFCSYMFLLLFIFSSIHYYDNMMMNI
jgi:hypothetical protein